MASEVRSSGDATPLDTTVVVVDDPQIWLEGFPLVLASAPCGFCVSANQLPTHDYR
jgi:hypothetical protein